MEYYAKTDIGKIRTKNQDQATVLINNNDQVLAVVCDGMGGHKAGEIASHVVIEYIASCFRANPPFAAEDEVVSWMRDTVLESHAIIKRMAKNDKDTEGMGTTVALAVIFDEEAYLCHVGDSRIYVISPDQITQVTRDHSLVNELVERGAISAEAAKTHSQKNVLTQAIGAEVDIVPSIDKVNVKGKDVLICSDGLYNSIDESTILEILKQQIPTQAKVNEMIDKANQNGGHDNIGIALVTHKGGN